MLRSRAMLLGAILLAASARPAAGSRLVPPNPYDAKEFTVIHHDGLFHVFYMRRDRTIPWTESYADLGHATSPDLVEWTEHDPILPIRPDNWDNNQIWAPHVILRDSTFYLFYTALTNLPGAYDYHQRIGLATSPDLYNWSRYDRAALACADAAWTFCDTSLAVGGDFRDPFVMPDPSMPGCYLAYHVARSDADHDQFLAGVARSTGDLMDWEGIMPLENTDRTKTQSYVTESPHLIEHDGLWYLFYTTWTPSPICFQVSADPLAPAGSWGPQRPLDTEVTAESTYAWFGSETFSHAGHDYFAAVDSWSYTIEFREMIWAAGGHFVFAEPSIIDTIIPPPPPPPPPLDAGSDVHGWRLATNEPPRWTRLTIVLDAPRAADVRLDVVDVSGRSRRGLMRGRVGAGASTLVWDGTDEGGTQVGSGVYFLLLRTPDRVLSRRVIRIR